MSWHAKATTALTAYYLSFDSLKQFWSTRVESTLPAEAAFLKTRMTMAKNKDIFPYPMTLHTYDVTLVYLQDLLVDGGGAI